MNKTMLVLAMVLMTGCTGSGDDQTGQDNQEPVAAGDQERVTAGYESAVDKARKARSDAEAAMEKARQEIEDNQPPD